MFAIYDKESGGHELHLLSLFTLGRILVLSGCGISTFSIGSSGVLPE